MRNSIRLIAPTLLLAPIAASAQTIFGGFSTGYGSGIMRILLIIGQLIQTATVIVGALALLYFFWGLAQFILNAGDEEGRKKGKQVMVWGLVALFVLFSIWGIIAVLQDTFLQGVSGGGFIDVRIFRGI